MNELQQMFERQARWQRTRRKLTWAEKIRLAEDMRESLIRLRKDKHATACPRPSQESSS